MNARLTLVASLVLGITSISALVALHMTGVTAMLVGIAASIAVALFSLTLMTQSWTRSDLRASTAAADALDHDDAVDEARDHAALAG
ncbi:MAG: hypothetical protein H7123_08860 [Thermoleophilia bacterium]|nr:hypothetical protein [Thermoleophilia bacterium]